MLQAMAHQHRLRILLALRDGPAQGADLSRRLAVEPTVLAHHLRQLRDLRLVTRRRRGTRVDYHLADDGSSALIDAALQYAAVRKDTINTGRV